MEEQINFNLLPSLQRRALMKTAVILCSQDDIRYFTADFDFGSTSFNERQKEWQVAVENKVIEKAQVLPIPESLKNKVSAFIKPICLEVLKWWNGHVCHFDIRFLKKTLKKICWTPQGAVDKKKTAEALIRDENLDIKERYKIACFYCLKNDILMLWNKMPEDYRMYFFSEKDPADVEQHPLVVLWTYKVKGEMTRMENFTRIRHGCTPYEYALDEAVLDGNQEATEYFLQKLSSEEREEWLVRSVEIIFNFTILHDSVDEQYSVVCFLLSQMNEEQQIEVLKDYSFRVLSCLLHWPWQDLFMKMAKHVWEFLAIDEFYDLLEEIVRRVKDGFKDYDYQYLFKEFWQQSPIAYKEHITDISTSALDFSLLHLLVIKDKRNIELILKDLTNPDREKVIIFTCKRILLCNDEIDPLHFFVQECLTTKDITIKFREELQKDIIRYRSKGTLEKEKDMWSKFFQLLDDLTQNCDNKRCMEDGNTVPAKRFCGVTSEKLSTPKEIADK